MKYVKYLLITLCSFFLVSCYEVNEEISIDVNGNGVYQAKMDMGQLIDLIQSFAGEEEITKDGLDRVVDTTILLKNMFDSSNKITPEQKELVKDGKMNLQMNMKERIFRMDVNVPYKGLDNLQKLMEGQGAGMQDLFSGYFGGKKNDDTATPDSLRDPQLDDVSGLFIVTVNNGLISKKIDTLKYKALMAKPQMADVKQMASSGVEILYTTTIKLPRPVKKADNPMVKLSDDKRTATVRYNLLDLLNDPGKFNYSIEY